MRNNQEYFLQLDAVRALAIFMVMVAHFVQYQWGNKFLLAIPFVSGVHLFFVLSGFLITLGLLKKKGKENYYIDFFGKRILRILPPYLLLVFILFVLNYHKVKELLIYLLTFTINIFQGVNNTVDVGDFNHFWSLAVEEQFYIVWPIVVLFLPNSKWKKVLLFAIGSSLMLRLYFVLGTSWWVFADTSLLTNSYSLISGAFLAYTYVFNKGMFNWLAQKRNLLLAAFLWIGNILVLGFVQSEYLKLLLLVMSNFLFVCLVAAAVYKGRGRVKLVVENRFVSYVGKISYGIYLIHQFVPKMFYNYNPDSIFISNKYVGFLGFSAVSILIASLSWEIYEKPILKLKSRFN